MKISKKHYYIAVTCVLASLFLLSCSSSTKIPAKGEFFGITVETTVDSEFARYYLETYLQDKGRDQALFARIDLLHKQTASLPNREVLKRISQEFSVDFASLFFASELLSNECNLELNQSFSHYLANDIEVETDISSYLLLFVPGWDYAENGPHTGADFAQPRILAQDFGIENYLVEIPPTGSVSENAAYLAAEIRRHGRSGKKILIAGASSAGPAIHLALGEKLRPEELRTVKAWLNLGGILQGSPLIDFLQRKPQRWLFNFVMWFKGWDDEAISSMGVVPSRERFERLRVNADIFTLNYIGIPLSGQLSKYSWDKYPLLKADGPNDGLTLVADVVAPNSFTVVALGSDHFFAEDPRINEKTVALMKLIITYLENDITSECSPPMLRSLRSLRVGDGPLWVSRQDRVFA